VTDAIAYGPEPVRFVQFQVIPKSGMIWALDTEGMLWGRDDSGVWGIVPPPMRPGHGPALTLEPPATGFVTCPYCQGAKVNEEWPWVGGRCFACNGKGVVVLPPPAETPTIERPSP
jgi:hypothetical protein